MVLHYGPPLWPVRVPLTLGRVKRFSALSVMIPVLIPLPEVTELVCLAHFPGKTE
jgi:hypothetical protein